MIDQDKITYLRSLLARASQGEWESTDTEDGDWVVRFPYLPDSRYTAGEDV